MRRRLDLAAALIGRPPVLFLDEPTTGLVSLRDMAKPEAALAHVPGLHLPHAHQPAAVPRSA